MFSGIDITFVMTVYNRGWILEKIADQIAESAHASGLITSKYFLYGGNRLHHSFPYSKNAFFLHYSNYYNLIDKIFPQIAGSPVIWFTHFEDKHGITRQEFAKKCNDYDAKVVCPCSSNHKELLEAGVFEHNLITVLGGYHHDLQELNGQKNNSKIAFVSACYPRKRPDLLFSVAERCKDYEFHIVGPRAEDLTNKKLLWSRSEYLPLINRLSNMHLHEVAYKDYAHIMSGCMKYLMLSDFEGGPIGLIEAMALGLVPIATDTGFARDLMGDELSENLLPVNPEVEDVINRIRDDRRVETRKLVKGMDWRGFSEKVLAFMKLTDTSSLREKGSDAVPFLLQRESQLRALGRYLDANKICEEVINSILVEAPVKEIFSSRLRINMDHLKE